MIDMDKKYWDQIIAVNLTGVFLTCKYAIRQMVQQKYGKVVLTSSNWAVVSDPGYANYCAAKGGVLSFGKAIALEYGHYNINVNVILPGNMYTPQLLNSVSFEKTDYDFIVSKIGMVSKPEDVANLVLFLSSDKASALKGASIFIDQGETIQYGKGIVNIK